MLAFAVFACVPEDQADTVVALEADAAVRAYAWHWQSARQGVERPVAGTPEDVVDALVVRIVSSGDEVVAEIGADVVEPLWRARSPFTIPVLETIAEEHPERVVVKAARKALFRRRSADIC
jgi:hypothetical protein